MSIITGPQHFYVGDTVEIPVPASWLSWRERLARVLTLVGLYRFARKLTFRPMVVTGIDEANSTITIDAEPRAVFGISGEETRESLAHEENETRGYLPKLLFPYEWQMLRRSWPGVAANS